MKISSFIGFLFCLLLVSPAIEAAELEDFPEAALGDYEWEFTLKGYRNLCFNPFDLDPNFSWRNLLTTPLGILWSPFLLLDELKATRQPDAYPYLSGAIYTPAYPSQEEIKENYATLRFFCYVLLTVTATTISFLGSTALGVTFAVLLFGWCWISLLWLYAPSLWVAILLTVILLLVGGRGLYRVYYDAKMKKKLKKFKKKAGKIKKTLMFVGLFCLITFYLLTNGLRLQLRIEANKNRKAKHKADGLNKPIPQDDNAFAALKQEKNSLSQKLFKSSEIMRQMETKIQNMQQTINMQEASLNRMGKAQYGNQYVTRIRHQYNCSMRPQANQVKSQTPPSQWYPNLKNPNNNAYQAANAPWSPRGAYANENFEGDQKESAPDGHTSAPETGGPTYAKNTYY